MNTAVESRPMVWSVRRELWEHRSIVLAPLVVAALTLLAFTVATIAGIWEKALRLDPAQPPDKLAAPYEYAALLLMATTFVVGVFYCLDALHGERRDRSVLFWKSMPVSDLTTVLSKAFIPLVLLPLLTFAVTVVTQGLMLLVSSAVLLMSGQNASVFWALPWLQMSAMLLYHLIVVHALWYAPIFAWLLLVSAWARRAPFVWAILPLVLIGALERMAMGKSYFGAMLGTRMSGGPHSAPVMPTSGSMSTHFHPEQLTSPAFWIGLAVAAVFLAGAVHLRRWRT